MKETLVMDGRGRALLAETIDRVMPLLDVLGESDLRTAALALRARLAAPGVLTSAEAAPALVEFHRRLGDAFERAAAELEGEPIAASFRRAAALCRQDARAYLAMVDREASPVA